MTISIMTILRIKALRLTDEGEIQGSTLVHLSKSNKPISSTKELSILKKMNRKRLKSLLGDKPLKSKELFFVN